MGCFNEKEARKDGERTALGRKRGSGQLSENELRAAINKVFDEYDKDKSNTLDKQEIAALLAKCLGRASLSESEINDFMSKLDSDGSNTIEREELFRLYRQLYC